MEDYIVNRISDIFGSVANAGSGNLILSPETFNSSIYNGIVLIMKNGVMPIAYILLGLLFMTELYSITIRTEGHQGTMGAEIPFRLMFKLAVCKMVVDSTELILQAIYGISSQLISNISSIVVGGNALTPADLAIIRATISNMDFAVKLMTSVEVTLIYLVVKFAMVIINVIVVGRMIELYILMAMAPIPIATFPNADLSGVAKNFLKSFAAVCLQGVIIFIVISIFPLLFANATMGDINDATQFNDSLMKATGYSFVLLISVFASGKWAKSICNAM